ncbi:MAG: PLP-dependent aminotransferase family protein [Actinomycetota bacterium]|nr:PLP-dependent aminotransferase family protein [Actinomycetota bacterium]
MELPVTLDRTDPRPLHLQLADQWRAAVVDGRLAANTRLPSSRVLAQVLGVSRHIVLSAVDELIIEGYLMARQGSGVWVSAEACVAPVAETVVRPGRLHRWQAWPAPSIVSDPPLRPGAIDFRLGAPGLERWSEDAWRRVWREVGRSRPPTYYNHPQGECDLREAVASYLGRARGLRCSAQQVLITSGSLASLYLLVHSVVRPGDRVGMEEPGYWSARQVLMERGTQVLPYLVDEDGLRVDALPSGQAAPVLVYCTPSHQYPLGGRLSLPRRQALLRWAEQEDVLIVEDDYDSEFRYDAAPLPALASLDQAGTVAYLGTFSKSLSPALRVGYMIGSSELIERLLDHKRLMDGPVAWPVQRALTAWMQGGHLEHHISQMRRAYARKRAILTQVFGATPSSGRLIGLEAGLHVVLELPAGCDAAPVATACAARGVVVQTMDPFYMGPAVRQGLLLGYGALDPADVERGAHIIAHVIENMGR